jgi:hypothetical protein
MFVLYAVPFGVLAGFVAGGRLEGLANVRFHWWPLAIAGLLVQVVLFSGRVDGLVGGWGPAIYVGSTVAVLAAVVRNLRIPGLAVVALGAASNLAAILANGGYMPADPAALAAAGYGGPASGYSNSVVSAAPALRLLTDIFAVPAGLPLANVFSIGDVLIAVGVALTITLAMRQATRTPA